jgi:hypothetical protein
MAFAFKHPAGFIMFMIVSLLATIFQFLAQAGYTLPVRRAPVLDRIDDAIGRATEMGGEVMAVTGSRTLHSARGLHAVLAFDVTRYVVERCIKLDTPALIFCCSGDHVPVAEDLARTAAITVGKPEAYQGPGTMVEYVEGSYPSRLAQRALIWSGAFKALIDFGGSHAWASPSVGMECRAADTTSIGGTSDIHSSGLYVACFDYAAIGDECWALSAYLSRDKRQLGTLIGLDMAKMIIIGMVVWGVIALAMGYPQPFSA